MDESTVRITEIVSIPISELHFRFARSSGPGGQHVNCHLVSQETRSQLRVPDAEKFMEDSLPDTFLR